MDPAEWATIVRDTETLVNAVRGNTPLFDDARIEAAQRFLDRYAHHLRWHQFEVTLYVWDPPYRGPTRAGSMTKAKHNMMVVQSAAKFLRQKALTALAASEAVVTLPAAEHAAAIEQDRDAGQLVDSMAATQVVALQVQQYSGKQATMLIAFYRRDAASRSE